MKKFHGSKQQEPLTLFVPYCQKPFLEHKKNVRGRNRNLFKRLEEVVREFEIALQRNEFCSNQLKEDTRSFLTYVKGQNKK